jgi:hypothetical protein
MCDKVITHPDTHAASAHGAPHTKHATAVARRGLFFNHATAVAPRGHSTNHATGLVSRGTADNDYR